MDDHSTPQTDAFDRPVDPSADPVDGPPTGLTAAVGPVGSSPASVASRPSVPSA